jgi:hypothetical protein
MNIISNTLLILVLLVLVIGLLIIVGMLLIRKRHPASQISIDSSIQKLRSIGQLSVFRVITKEIVTETDHSWGEFGRRYLRWIMSEKKMAMIFEFEIDFRYDLRRPEFEIIGTGENAYMIKMPPCFYEANIRDIRFYDEQKSRFLPWLLPDLLEGIFSDGFSEEHKNKLIKAARDHAEQQARKLIENMESEVERSARQTLQSISKAFGVENVAFEFQQSEQLDLKISSSRKVTEQTLE